MGISHVVVNNELIFTLNDFLLCLESARLMGKRLPQNRTPLPPPFPQTACKNHSNIEGNNFQKQRCNKEGPSLKRPIAKPKQTKK